MEDLISVIIPVYNVEKYLCQCIESVLNQTYENIEIILVDDGSVDCSPQICEEYALKDNRIVVIHKKNGGLSSARNAGIKICKGNYLCFVDSDDYIHQQMIEKLYYALKKTEADLVICGFKYVYDEEFQGQKKQICSKINNEVINSKEAMKRLFIINGWQYVVAWNKLYKTQTFENLFFKEGYIHEDEIIIHKIFEKNKKIVLISDVLYNYRQRDGSIMKTKYNIQRLDLFKAFEDRIIYFYRTGQKALSKNVANIFWGEIVNKYFLFQQNKKNKLYLKRTLKSFRRVLPYFLLEITCNWKEKVSMIMFAISPQLYRVIWMKNNTHERNI